jgi:hypothetical protein
MQARVQGQLRTRQEQRERVVLGLQLRTLAGGDRQPGSTGRDHPRTVRAAGLLQTFDRGGKQAGGMAR